jgi:DNA helicase-2/ATP-dependent DNA helicase PcrA
MAREYVLHSDRGEASLRIDYAAELNPEQRVAVTAPPGPALVLAGAGSGKTRTLTYRVAYLIEQGIDPERILLLTFTNKAAREMMRRVADLLGAELSGLWGGTFHAIGARLLRINAAPLGLRPDFSILDREDSQRLLKTCLNAIPVHPPRLDLKLEAIAGMLSRAVNDRTPLSDRFGDHAEDSACRTFLERLSALYTDRKRTSNSVDFDDLLSLWLRLLEEHPDARERYQRRFQWVLVDEYQDTNRIQSDLIDCLAAQHRNVMAVGDDSQSIYSWRGANFRNILEFPKRYPDTQIFKIGINYRSTPEILAVANAAIARNTRQFPKQLTPSRPTGPKPAVVACESGQQQAAFVVQRIHELIEDAVSPSQIAVLYRSHFHALELQLELTRQGIPFLITSGMRFFEQAHIKDVTAWLKLLANPADELAFNRVVLLLPGIGERAAERLWQAFLPAYAESARRAQTPSGSIAEALIALQKIVPKKAAVTWAALATTFAQMEQPEINARPADLFPIIVNGFYEEYARDSFENAASRMDDLDQLAEFAVSFDSVTEFLTQLSLLTDIEAESEPGPTAAGNQRVRLSTVHQAKGLEFGVVFVIMLGEGLFPTRRSMENPESSEEERRLFYVAVTRARDQLYLCHPSSRSTPGQGSSRYLRSHFLDELPDDLVEKWELRIDPYSDSLPTEPF